MKRKIVLFFAALVFASCANTNEGNCEACDGTTGVEQEINIAGKSFKVKRFLDKRYAYGFGYADDTNLDNLEDLIGQLEDRQLPHFDHNEMVALSIYTENKLEDKKLSADEIYGVMVYFKKIKSNQLYVRIFEKKTTGFIENSKTRMVTNMLTSNDVTDVGAILGKGKPFNSLTFIDYDDMPKNPSKKSSELENYLKGSKKEMKLYGSGPGCAAPCPGPETPNHCGFINREWFCDEGDELCLTDAEIKEGDVDPLVKDDYEFQQKPILHGFRDSNLGKSGGGSKFVYDYYALSAAFPQDSLNLSDAMEMYNLIKGVAIPMGTELLTNPTAKTKLYNSSTELVLVDFLKKMKMKFIDQPSKNRIDAIIAIIQANADKSNEDVYKAIESH